jgi:predicted ATPase
MDSEYERVIQVATDFISLPPEYQEVIRLAQEKLGIIVSPLQELLGGWSDAAVYLVSVSFQESKRVEHYVLKLDHKNPKARSDEITRHKQARGSAPADFASHHMAEMAFERIEQDGAIAIFYAIAGQSLLNYQPLSRYERQAQLGEIFRATCLLLLEGWNEHKTVEQALHPQQILKQWLGFRIEPDQPIERFLSAYLHIRPETPGFIIHQGIFPNPLVYARQLAVWRDARPIDIFSGFIHGDLNTNNILVKFSPEDSRIEGYYLIDFALYKEGLPLLYDQRYLEMSYLILKLSQVPFQRMVQLLVGMGDEKGNDPALAPVELAGVSQLIKAAREAFAEWVQERHPSLSDDLWGQFCLAGVAAGLTYTHKTGLPDEARLAGLIFAAANLKRYASLFGIPGPNMVQQLYDSHQPASEMPVVGTIAAPSYEPPNNLPNQATNFIGRADQVAGVKDLLTRQDIRLITLSGPGGTGKTRLAIQVAAELLDHFPEGVLFVSLAEVSQLDMVVPKIAQQLEVRQGGSRPLLENLKSYLRDKCLLLILDNFEQVVSSAPLVIELLAAAPELKVLVTSRKILNLRGEHVYPVPPLKIPQGSDLSTVLELKAIESVQLFIDRAEAADPGFSLTEKNKDAIAAICQRLDGLPLAIELTAARLNLLPPEVILARMDNRLKLLTGGARDLPARQRTLRDTIDWSYGLLDEHEQGLFARLGVFVGGFDLEAAEVICSSKVELDVFEGIAGLVNDSLLQREESATGRPRFRMLETLREYALERLEELGEGEEMRHRHAHFYTGKLVDEMGFKVYHAEANTWLNWIESELDNIEATLAWTQSTAQGLEMGPPLIAYLTWFWYRRGYFHEGRRWAEQVLDSPAAREGSLGRAMALQGCSLLALWQADLMTARSRADECLQLWQGLRDDHFLGIAFMNSGIVLINMGEDSAAHPVLVKAQELFKAVDDPFFYAITLVHLGNVALGLGNVQEAQGWLDRAYTLSRENGEDWTISFALNNLGELARVKGDYLQAGKWYRQSEALLRKMGDKGDLARLIHNQGCIALHADDLNGAESHYRRSLTMFRRLGNQRGIAECLAGLAGLSAARGQHPLGARLLGAAHALMNAVGAAWWPADRSEIERYLHEIQSNLAEDAFDRAWTSGENLTLEQAVALASTKFAETSNE